MVELDTGVVVFVGAAVLLEADGVVALLLEELVELLGVVELAAELALAEEDEAEELEEVELAVAEVDESLVEEEVELLEEVAFAAKKVPISVSSSLRRRACPLPLSG